MKEKVLDFEEILVDNLNHAVTCLDSIVSGYHLNINISKLIEAETVIKQTLQLIYLKNKKSDDNN